MTVNHIACRPVRRSAVAGVLICAALAVALPIRAHAQFSGKVSATGQFESNSNVFALESGAPPPEGDGRRRSDTFFAYGADFDLRYAWGRQEIYATADTHEYSYQHFFSLDHNDYKVDTGLNWKLGSVWDGKIEVMRTHTMVPFSDLSGSALQLSVSTEQREAAQIGLKLNSEWKIQVSGYTSKGDEPIAGAPNLQLTQNSGTTSILYLGFGALTSGLTATYLSGDYSGTNGTLNPSFNQTTAGLLATYQVKRTTFDGQVGYSRRSSSTGTDNTSGLTGLFDLQYQLTPKTSFTVKIDRSINSYYLNSGSEIDTEAGASVLWQTTYKLGVSAGYTFTYRFYPGQGNNPLGSDRTDIQELATLSINYQPQRWLQIKPYANVTTRRSTFIGGHFSQNAVGVSVVVTPYKSK